MALLAGLSHLSNLSQFVSLGQGRAYQKEEVRWQTRNFALDLQALKSDLLSAAREDMLSTYETCVERLDTLLLLNALTLPFGLSVPQFSDEFIPRTKSECATCVEAEYPFFIYYYVYLIAAVLVMPFWAILLLLHAKMVLDNWLREALRSLQGMREELLSQSRGAAARSEDTMTKNEKAKHDQVLADEHRVVVERLSNFLVQHRDSFTVIWKTQCSSSVLYASRLLWSSILVAILVASFMFWLYLANRSDSTNFAAYHFVLLLVVGLLIPLSCMLYECYKAPQVCPPQAAEARTVTTPTGAHCAQLASTNSAGSLPSQRTRSSLLNATTRSSPTGRSPLIPRTTSSS